MFPDCFSEDIIIYIAHYTDLRTRLAFASVNKFTWNLIEQTPRLWLDITERLLPGFFDHTRPRTSRVYRRRLRHWTENRFDFRVIGGMSTPLFLARSCGTKFRGKHIVFGGEVEARALSNAVSVTWFSEDENKVYMSQVTVPSGISPAKRKACAMCSVTTEGGEDHIFMFGGAVEPQEGTNGYLCNEDDRNLEKKDLCDCCL